MKSTISRQAGRRALVSLLGAALITSGVAVPTAHAQTEPAACTTHKPRPGVAGALTLKDSYTYAPGDTVTVTGQGFEGADYVAFKIDDNAKQWGVNQTDAQLDALDAPATEVYLPGSHIRPDGSFEVSFVLPTDLDQGWHTIRALTPGKSVPLAVAVGSAPLNESCFGGKDIPPLKSAEDNDTGDGSDSGSDSGSDAGSATAANAVTSDTPAGFSTRFGQSVAPLTLTGYTPGATITAFLDGEQLEWAQGRNTTTEAPVIGEDGSASLNAALPKTKTPAGTYTLLIRSSAEADAEREVQVTTLAAARASSTAQNSESTVTVLNIPNGATITRVGTEGVNWLSAEQQASPVAAADTTAVVEGVAIPADAPLAAPIQVDYRVGDATTTLDVAPVSPDNSEINPEQYTTTTAYLPTGLYQSAVNEAENTLFVTRSNGRPPLKESNLYKLDATTLETIAEVEPPLADPADPSKGLLGVYGVGLDNARGLVWTTNTRQDTVTIYKQSDLSVVKQFPAGSAPHARDVVVDESNGHAFVSTPTNPAIEVFSPEGKIKTINLNVDGKDFGSVMSLAYDPASHTLVAPSRTAPYVAKINTLTDEVSLFTLPEEMMQGGSGMGYDAARQVVYVAGQGSNNVVAYSLKDDKVVADIPTGGRALNATYASADDLVYVTNRDGGTVTVIDAKTNKVVNNLNAGGLANHTSVSPKGVAYTVNKEAVERDGVKTNMVTRFVRVAAETPEPPAKQDPQQPGSTPGSTQGSGNTGGILAALLGGLGLIGALIGGLGVAIRDGHIQLPEHVQLPAWLNNVLGR